MTANAMSISTFLKIAPQLLPQQSVMLRGNHGIGKSSLAKQVASLLRKNLRPQGHQFPFIDRRLSQVSEGDIIGLPSTDGETTRFNPPDWYKRACLEPCFLFLDELNRATPEVMQAAFQIVLDHELNGWRLHPLTRVYSAINTASNYNVNEVDPALLDRFWVIDLNATPDDWISWGRSAPSEDDEDHAGLKTNVDPAVVDFIINSQHKWLDPATSYEPNSKQPSRRSWDKLSMTLVRGGMIDTPDDAFYQICIGFVGVEAAIALKDFVKTIDSRISGDDILNNFAAIEERLGRLGTEKLNAAIDKASSYILANCKKLNAAQSKNLNSFMKMLPGELRISLWSKLTVNGTNNIELARSIHSAVCAEVMDVFGVPMGEAGIGVMPTVPGIFKKEGPSKS